MGGEAWEPWEVGDTCVVCGSPHVQIHHIFEGYGRRKISDKYGYVIPLCFNHHIGNNGIHLARNKEHDLYWKRKAQKHFEANRGTRDEFIRLFGKSYLEE